MGIIIRQSLKQTIIAMVAVFIAGVAQLFIYANHREIAGEAYFILNTALFLVPIVSLGLPTAVIRYFAQYGKGKQGYILNFILLATVSLLLFGGLYLLFRPYVSSVLKFLNMSNDGALEQYKWTILILIVLTIIFKLFTSLSSNYNRIVWPGIFDLLWGKVALVMIISSVIIGWLPIESFHYTLPAFMLVSVFGMMIYLKYLGVLNLSLNKALFKAESLKDIGEFSAFTGLNSLGGMMASRIDLIMVPTIIGMAENGAYTLFLFMAQVIDLPSRSMTSIAAPIISKSLAEDDLKEVKLIYDKSSLTLFTVGVGLFSLIFLNFKDVFKLTGESEVMDGLILVFVALGIGKIMATTFKLSGQIILYSPYYRFLLYVTLFLGLMNVVLNHLFINYWMVDTPLIGVAIATAMSLSVYVCSIVVFVKIKYNLLPIHIGMAKVVFVFAAISLLASVIPSANIPILDILIRTSLFAVISIFVIYYLRISMDVNKLIDKVWLAIKNRDFKNLI